MASVLGDTIGSAMSAVIGKFFDTFLVFLTKGGEKECPANMQRIQDGMRVYCRAKWRGDDTWLKAQSDKADEDSIYFKPSKRAEDRQIVSAKNCPPGMFPFNGSCWASCPPNFERQEVPYSQAEKDKASASKQTLKKRYRCVAQCEKDWHVYNWTNTGNALFNQGIPDLSEYCYHAPPDPDYGEVWEDIARNMPYTLETPISETQDWPGARAPRLDPETHKPVTSDEHFPARGVYAQRKHFQMPAAVDPLPCTDPYKSTPSGRCVKSCDAGYDLYGELCFKTTAQCPADWVEDGDSHTFCRPKTVPMPRYWSILQIVLALAVIAAVAAVIGRAVTRPRTG